MDSEEKTPNTVEVLVRCLEDEGVKYAFGIPGEENLSFVQALKDSSIEVIITRHEQGAAFMADMYGRLTGEAGVCFSTLGPGATNLITGIADANSDGAPVVAITGQVGTDRLHITTHQYLDLEQIFKPLTKRTKQVLRPETMSEIVQLAFKYAESEKPGAVHIDIPQDIAAMPVSDPIAQIPMRKQTLHHEYASSESINEAVKEIESAKHPVVLAGHGAVRSKAGRAIKLFAEALHIPVINTMMAKGIIPYDSTYAMGTIGFPQKDYTNKIIENADLVIAVGYDIVEFAPGKWNAEANHRIVHIDNRAAHVNKLYQADVEVVGDISDSLIQIYRLCKVCEEPKRALEIKAMKDAELESYANDNSWPPKPQKILYDVRHFMGKDDILVSDVGAHKMWIAREYECYSANTCIVSNGFATMGIGVPGAITAKLINPDKKVLAVVGDGGFMMNNQEMETAFRIGTPIVVLIFTDASYGLIKWKQDIRYGSHCYVDFTNPDFAMMAESMHCKGYRIEKTEDIIPTLEDAFKQTVPSVIECPVDYRENLKLTKMLMELYPSLK